MWTNHEVGTLQPIPEVVRIAHAHGIPVHSDAVGAVGQVAADYYESGVDALTFTGHKLGGPQGVGALVIRSDLAVDAWLHGGGQERGIRSGTPGVAAIAGFAEAVDIAVRRQPENAALVARLRDALVRRICTELPDASVNGYPCSSDRRLPGPSRILLASGAQEYDARCNLRVTLGHTTTQAEVDAFVDAIGSVARRACVRPVAAGGLVRIRQSVPG